jgi:hypothetical protein
MFSNYFIKAIFLLLSNIFFLIFSSQLNSFYEDWEPRSFEINFDNIDIQNEINSPFNVQININSSNVIADVLPSHFGTNLTHFLGQSVINSPEFITNIKNLGSAFVIKVFEDENANGSYDSGIDEAYALKVNLNTDSQWHKYCNSFSNFIIDQSGNNILVDGILNPKNIIRIDITNSQSGSANGQFGYLADYFLITYNEPL